MPGGELSEPDFTKLGVRIQEVKHAAAQVLAQADALVDAISLELSNAVAESVDAADALRVHRLVTLGAALLRYTDAHPEPNSLVAVRWATRLTFSILLESGTPGSVQAFASAANAKALTRVTAVMRMPLSKEPICASTQ